MMKRCSSFILVLLLISAIRIQAQQFVVTVDRNPVAVGETFELTYTFSGSDINGLSAFNPPSLQSFIVLGGPNQSQSMQIINGSVSGSRSFSYYLQAKEKGKFTIAPASVVNRGTTIKSQSISIEVVQGSAKPKQQAGNDDAAATGEIAENVYIRAIADKSSAYIGEQVNITYKLYFRLNISNPEAIKLPSYPGFWSEEVPLPQNQQLGTEIINGKQFRTFVLKQVALFPSQAGELAVTPLKLQIPVQVQKKQKSRNPFDDFFSDPFFAQMQKVNFESTSNTVRITAKPLPEQNKPADFTGAVGTYTMSVKPDKTTGKQNEPIALKVTISGNGNLQLLPTPVIDLPPTIEKYDPKITDEIERSGLVGGQKSFEFILVPRVEGKLEIPAVSYSYFDIQKKKYETLTSQPISIIIEKGDGSFAGGSSVDRERVRLLGQDIRYIKNNLDRVNPKGYSLVHSPLAWGMFLSPLLLLATVLGVRYRQNKLLLNKDFVRNRKAERLAKNKLKSAAKAMQMRKVDDFYTELSGGLTGYAENKFAIDRADLTIDSLREQLQKLNFPVLMVDTFCSLIEKCEYARFAPAHDKEVGMKTLYEDAKSLIVKIESGAFMDERGTA